VCYSFKAEVCPETAKLKHILNNLSAVIGSIYLMFKKLLCIVFSLAISSCYTLNIPPDYELDAKPHYGLAVFSISSNYTLDNFRVYYGGSSDFSEYVVSGHVKLKTAETPLDWVGGDLRGRLAVIELPEGKYSFMSIHRQYPSSTLSGRFDAPFEVEANKATYLGDLAVLINPERTKFKAIIFDSSERDLPLLFNRYPNIKKENVIVKISKVQKYIQKTFR
ncbi:hypothetical protein, partial [Zooshikella harenae]